MKGWQFCARLFSFPHEVVNDLDYVFANAWSANEEGV
jgi:hypothetical protein